MFYKISYVTIIFENGKNLKIFILTDTISYKAIKTISSTIIFF